MIETLFSWPVQTVFAVVFALIGIFIIVPSFRRDAGYKGDFTEFLTIILIPIACAFVGFIMGWVLVALAILGLILYVVWLGLKKLGWF